MNEGGGHAPYVPGPRGHLQWSTCRHEGGGGGRRAGPAAGPQHSCGGIAPLRRFKFDLYLVLAWPSRDVLDVDLAKC